MSGYIFAFSPNGRRLIYEVDGRVTLLDFYTGEKLPLDFGEGMVGDFTWAPDGKRLAFATCLDNAETFTVEKSTVQIYDLESGKYQMVFQAGENHHLHVDSWEEIDLLKALDMDFIAGKEIELLFDPGQPAGR